MNCGMLNSTPIPISACSVIKKAPCFTPYHTHSGGSILRSRQRTSSQMAFSTSAHFPKKVTIVQKIFNAYVYADVALSTNPRKVPYNSHYRSIIDYYAASSLRTRNRSASEHFGLVFYYSRVQFPYLRSYYTILYCKTAHRKSSVSHSKCFFQNFCDKTVPPRIQKAPHNRMLRLESKLRRARIEGGRNNKGLERLTCVR